MLGSGIIMEHKTAKLFRMFVTSSYAIDRPPNSPIAEKDFQIDAN